MTTLGESKRINNSKINLVVIGHKDHGKSTLIGRLLYDSKAIHEQKLKEIYRELEQIGEEFQFAFLLDSLEEERRGGLTIDIMHTPLKSQKNLYTIIDCPGHKEFIRKMLTGTSQADAAILVVSVKERIQDQTRQHMFLAKMLGIQQLVIAVNKMDLVKYKIDPYLKTCNELKPILTSLHYNHDISMVPISAMKGDNVYNRTEKMKWYNGTTLIETLDQTITPTSPPVNKPLRGVVHDVYTLENNQKIIVCRIETGTLKPEESIIFNPSGKKGLLKKIIMSDAILKEAEPRDSVGLIIAGIDSIPRGEVLSHPENQPKIVKEFTAEVILLSNVPFENGDEVTIRYGTAEKKCQIKTILSEIDPINLTVCSKYPKKLKNESVGKVEFLPLEPLCIENYSEFPELGRFIIKGKKGTAAAGIVLDTL